MQLPFGDTGSCLVDKNDVSNCDEDDETIYDTYQQLIDLPEENLDLLFPPQRPQDHCPSILQSPMYTKLGNVSHPLQPQEYQPSILQPPMSTKLGNGLDVNGGCEYWQSTSKKKILTKEFVIPVRHVMSNFENQATEYIEIEIEWWMRVLAIEIELKSVCSMTKLNVCLLMVLNPGVSSRQRKSGITVLSISATKVHTADDGHRILRCST